jgi:hypothetical protein
MHVAKLPRVVMAAMASAFVLAAPTARAGSEVQLTREGESVKLSHVTAVRYVDSAGKQEIRLLFTPDKPEGVELADAFGGDTVNEWAVRPGSVLAKIVFEESKPEQYQLAILREGRGTAGGGTSTDGVVRELKVGKDVVSGVVQAQGGEDTVSGPFEAPLTTVTAVKPVMGPVVASSAQAKALLAFARALSKKDYAGAQRHSTREVEKELREMQKEMGDEIIAEILQEFAPANVEKELKSAGAELHEAGDAAMIRISSTTEGMRSSKSYRFVKVGSDWKLK